MTAEDSPTVQVVLDTPELLARLENDRELLGELLEIFKEECPSLLRSLEKAISDEDMKGVETAGHTLKGMLATLSATRAASAASQLERMGHFGEKPGLRDALTILESEVVVLLIEMNNCLEAAEK